MRCGMVMNFNCQLLTLTWVMREFFHFDDLHVMTMLLSFLPSEMRLTVEVRQTVC